MAYHNFFYLIELDLTVGLSITFSQVILTDCSFISLVEVSYPTLILSSEEVTTHQDPYQLVTNHLALHLVKSLLLHHLK